jgi:homoserine dehydrogenase
MSKNLRIGLFGFGCVGQGLYDIIHQNKHFDAEIAKICVKQKGKQRSLPADYFTFDKNELLHNPDIQLIVELIDNAQEAFEIVAEALRQGKTVVTANKKMLAEHLEELLLLQKEYQGALLYEGAACGSIPIIRNLEEYYDNELLHEVSGIFNGSSNYILSKITQEKQNYQEALRQAQALGFAESDPTLDVGAFDPKYKLIILALHAYGIKVAPEEVLNYGIEQFSEEDLRFVNEKNYKIKLVATSRKLNESQATLFVMPQLIPPSHYLYHVEYENNAVIVEAAFSQKQVFIGKGAGGHPTGSAVLSDISAALYQYRYAYKKAERAQKLQYTREVLLEIYLRYQQPEDLALLEFQEISEQYQGRGFHYAIGLVSLEKLYQQADALKSRGVFIANTGRQPELLSAYQLKETLSLAL